MLDSSRPAQFTQRYRLLDPGQLDSPQLLLFREALELNLAAMIDMAGNASRLRPHCKTHKCGAITRRELELGITKHKCATLAEAEMLAAAGADDVFLAYNPVGPNLARLVQFRRQFPQVRLAVAADHVAGVAQLSECMQSAGLEIDVLLDVDVGMHRTGTTSERGAVEVYRQMAKSPGIRAAGLHVYDGQNHQTPLAERKAAVLEGWALAQELRGQLLAAGCEVPKIVAGGTGSFPVFAEIEDPLLELSPGTPVLYDAGYSRMFPDLPFAPAALLLTRVISLPGADRLTLDLGYKAVASDPPVERRAVFPSLPDAKIIGQSEEHLMLQTAAASRFSLGDWLLAVPWHVCPTTALHREMIVIEGGAAIDRWEVTARDRRLSI